MRAEASEASKRASEQGAQLARQGKLMRERAHVMLRCSRTRSKVVDIIAISMLRARSTCREGKDAIECAVDILAGEERQLGQEERGRAPPR